MSVSIQPIINEAETLKKTGDVHFARNQFGDAIESYHKALMKMSMLRGSPLGESLVIRCFANQSQCYLKINSYEDAVKACNIGISVPSCGRDSHLLSKLYFRRAVAFESLEKYEEALISLDRVIAINVEGDQDAMRTRIINSIVNQGGIVPIPPKPISLQPEVIENIIIQIFQASGDPDTILPIIGELAPSRGWFDVCDKRGNNLLWAVCQSSLKRAIMPSKDPDAVFPLLFAILQCEARAEQRFTQQANRTPLQVLSMAGAHECMKLAIKFGAGVHTFDDDRWTPLVVACAPNGPFSGRNSKAVQVLIDAGSNVNHITSTGMSPLLLAAQSGDLESVKLLISAGAKLNHRCLMGFSCLVWARIGSAGVDSDTQRFILEAVQAIEASDEHKEQLAFEFDEDMRCFNISALLDVLKKSHNISTEQGITSAAVDLKLIETTKTFFNISQSIEENTLPIVLFEEIISKLPKLLYKKWQPKVSGEAESLNQCIEAAPFLHKCWLNILTTAAFGPPQPGMPSPLVTNPSLDYFYLRLFDEFEKYIRTPFERTFGKTLPLANVLSLLSSTTAGRAVSELKATSSSSSSSNVWANCLTAAEFQVDTIKFDYSIDGKGLEELSAPISEVVKLSCDNLLLVASSMIPACISISASLDARSPSIEQALNKISCDIVSSFNGSTVIIVGPAGPAPAESSESPSMTVDHSSDTEDFVITKLTGKLIHAFAKDLETIGRVDLPGWPWFAYIATVYKRKELQGIKSNLI